MDIFGNTFIIFSEMDYFQDNNETISDPNFTPAPSSTLEYILNAIQFLIGFIGAVGNGLVCYVIFNVRRQQNFTNSLIVSQSAIDFLASILFMASIISLTVNAQPPANHSLAVLYCVFWHSRCIIFACWAISTFNLTAIAIERYLAIIHPIWYHQTFTRKHAWILATTAWLVAPIMQTIIGARYSKLENGQCDFIPPPNEQAVLGVLVFLWDYFIPLCIMAFSFIRIAFRLNQLKQSSESELMNPEMHEKIMRRKNVTKALFSVFALYVICWTPGQFTFLQLNLGGMLEFGGAWHSFAFILGTTNSAVNPFVYALRFKQYKEGLKSLFPDLKKCGTS